MSVDKHRTEIIQNKPARTPEEIAKETASYALCDISMNKHYDAAFGLLVAALMSAPHEQSYSDTSLIKQIVSRGLYDNNNHWLKEFNSLDEFTKQQVKKIVLKCITD